MENISAREGQLRRAAAGMAGLAIGDALGMQYETLTHEQIMGLTFDRGVQSFDSPGPKEGQRVFSEMSNLKVGDTTDDTQLARVIAESLIAKGDFDLEDLARGHVRAMDETSFGWGSSTKKSVQEIKLFLETNGVEGRSWNERASNESTKGTGNGIAMKVAPLVLFYLFRNGSVGPQLGDWVMQLAYLTHRDPRAGHAAYALAQTIAMAMWSPLTLEHDHSMRMLDITPIEVIAMNVRDLEKKYPAEKGMQLVSDQLFKIHGEQLLYNHNMHKLREEIGVSWHAVESVPFAIAIILRNLKDFRKGVLEAVNSGGDTDTIAAMVGCVLGILNPNDIPSEWLDFRPEYREIGNLGRKVAETASALRE